MNHPVTLTQLVLGNKQRNEANPRLQGHWLALARILWIALAILILILYVVGFPAAFQYLKTVCVAAGCNGPQLTPEQARTLQSQGLTLSFFAMYLLAFELVFMVVWFLVATLIFWRKSTERLAWFVSLALLTFGAAFVDPLSVLTQQHSIWRWPGLVVSFIGVISLVLSLYLFPDGRFVPRWTSLVGIFWFPWNLYWLFFTGSMYTSLLWGFSYAGVLGLGVFAQIYRYLRVSNPTRRQQTKWVVYGFTLAIVVFLALIMGGLILPSSLIEIAAQAGAVAALRSQEDIGSAGPLHHAHTIVGGAVGRGIASDPARRHHSWYCCHYSAVEPPSPPGLHPG